MSKSLKKVVEEIWTGIDADIDLPDRILPDPGLVDTYRFREQRKLFLDSDVEICAAQICDAILLYNCEDKGKSIEDRREITLYISSDGGSLDEMWSLIDMVSLSVTPVWTVNLGMAASAAALVYLAGEKRLMMPNATIMLHEGSAQMRGDASKVVDAVDNYSQELKRMREFVLSRTKIPKEVLEQHRKDDWYLGIDLCLEYEICHQMVTSLAEIV